MESYLLSKEFQQFSQRVRKLYEEKESKKAEMQSIYEKYTLEMKQLEDAALKEQTAFEEWMQKSDGSKASNLNLVDSVIEQEYSKPKTKSCPLPRQ